MSKCSRRTQQNFKIIELKYPSTTRVGERVEFKMVVQNKSLIFGDTLELCLFIGDIEVFKKRERIAARTTAEYFTSVTMDSEGKHDVHLSVKDINLAVIKQCEDFRNGSIKVFPSNPSGGQLIEELLSSPTVILTVIAAVVGLMFFT